MGAIRNLSALLAVGLLICTGSGRGNSGSTSAYGAASANSLFAQSAAQILNREFNRDEISFLLLDAQTGVVLASRWDKPDKPIPLGSLVKPFTALSYAEAHHYRYPVHVCRGEATGCWLPRGHGEVNITSAIANSCNSYFRALTAGMTGQALVPVATRFDFDAPAASLSGAELTGLGNRWPISPLHMARAYLELIRRKDEPGVAQLLAGMAQSARAGTGAAVDRQLTSSDALVKTGTASCTHRNHAPGDGFVVALVPASQPKLLVMVRVHGVPGARAAITAGQMLHRIEE